MFSPPEKPEIDHRTIKLIIGLIALTLANVTSFFSSAPLTSISASYYQDGWARNFFVGFLFAIAAFMLAYNGLSRKEMLLSKGAAAAAFAVAMFPCGCDAHIPPIPYVHYIAAAVMFAILAYFCWLFRERALAKGYPEALRRSKIYVTCGLIIVAVMAILALDHFTHASFTAHLPSLTFYCEWAGLAAFGVSWLTASKVLPGISSQSERFSPFG